MTEQRAEDALTPKFLNDIDALNPPEIAVPPITPFISDEQLPDNPAFPMAQFFSDEINSSGPVLEQLAHAGLDTLWLEFPLLSFPRHPRVKVCNHGRIGEFRFSNSHLIRAMVG